MSNLLKKAICLLFINYSIVAVARTSMLDLENRLEVLEEKFQRNISLEIVNKIDFLQKEIQELRGMLEEQQYSIYKISAKNKKLDHLKERTNNPDNAKNIDYNTVTNFNGTFKSKETSFDPEKVKYNYACKMIEELNFPQAIIEFKDFLTKYSNSRYVPDSHYWLGELYLNENKLDLAESYFLKVAEYKEHSKAPEALFKLAILEIDRKNFTKAKEYFLNIINNYNSYNKIKIARSKLMDLEKIEH